MAFRPLDSSTYAPVGWTSPVARLANALPTTSAVSGSPICCRNCSCGTAIEDHREALIADDLAHRVNHIWQALGQVAADLCGHHQQLPLGRVRHTAHIDDLCPNLYLGYFENEHGEQAVCVYDRDSKQAVLYLGDAGWETSHTVVDGAVPDLVLSEVERLWVRACWQADFRARSPEF
jgi:hypothetical protein